MMGLQYTRRLGTSVAVGRMLRYDTIRDAILTCARKPTRVSLIYRTETTTKKCKTEKLKSKKTDMLTSNSKSMGNHVVSPEEEMERLPGIFLENPNRGCENLVGAFPLPSPSPLFPSPSLS